MIFQEPKMEFVPIDLSESVITNSCNQFGVETCMGDAPMNQCNDDVDWL